MADPVFVDNVTPLNAVNMNKLQTRDEKAVANGYPSLDATGKVPVAQLPPSAGGADLTYEGDYVPATSYQDGDVVVKDGIAYLCVGGPTTTAPDPAPWGAGRPTKESELVYTEFTARVSVPASTAEATPVTVITAPSLTLDGATTVLIEFFCPRVDCSNPLSNVIFNLWDGGTNLGRMSISNAPGNISGAGSAWPVRIARRLTPSAGAHTYTVRAWSGAGDVDAGAGGAAGVLVPGYIRIAAVSSPIPIIPGASLPVSYGTTLPVSPVDGQEAILVDNATNPTYQWRFRYNANSTSPYKWEFVGGAPVGSGPQGSMVTTTTGWTDLTSGPGIIVPRAGDYVIQGGISAQCSAYTSTYFTQAAIKAGSTLNPVPMSTGAPIQWSGSSISQLYRIGGLAAASLINLQAQNDRAGGGSTTWSNGWLAVTPVRVS